MAFISGAELNPATSRNPEATAIPSGAPPTADAAVENNTKFVYKSLCDALNAYERQLVEIKRFEYANVYEIELSPELKKAKVALKGATDTNSTATQSGAVAAISPEKNSAAMDSKILSTQAGTQIIQFIEQTVRDSSYITDQQIENKDQTTPGSLPIPSIKSVIGNTTWFKILVRVVPISDNIDKGRNDYAYKITYIVVPFDINEMVSNSFPPAKFRGVHKVYNYWFTGLNTQVLRYEQTYNNLYTITAGYSNLATGIALLQSKDTPATAKIGNMATDLGPPKIQDGPPNESTKGAPNDANTPAATAADFLYSAPDQKTVTVKIVGDPAWLLQGEMLGVTAAKLTGQAFYPDGTICTETQEAVFAINFNSPADYNNGASGPASGTGLVDINAVETNGNSNNLSKAGTQASAAYKATDVVSTFSKGQFEQTLTGAILKNLNPVQINKFIPRDKPNTNTNANANANANANVTGSRTPSIYADDPENLPNVPGVKYNPVPASTTTSPNSATPVVNRGTQPAAPAKPATSEGVVVGTRVSNENRISFPTFTKNDPQSAEDYRVYVSKRARELQQKAETDLRTRFPDREYRDIINGATFQAKAWAEAEALQKFDVQIKAAGAYTEETTSTPITKPNPAQSAPKDQ